LEKGTKLRRKKKGRTESRAKEAIIQRNVVSRCTILLSVAEKGGKH